MVFSTKPVSCHPYFIWSINLISLLCSNKVKLHLLFFKSKIFIALYQEPQPLANLPAWNKTIIKTVVSCPNKEISQILFFKSHVLIKLSNPPETILS